MKDDIAAIKRTKLLQSNWYRERYPDVAKLGMDPAEHYLKYGARLGRDPSPAFDTQAYLKENPDVATSGMNPLLHYALYGEREGRSIVSPEREPQKDLMESISAFQSKLADPNFAEDPLAALSDFSAKENDPIERAHVAHELALYQMRSRTGEGYRIALKCIAAARKSEHGASLGQNLTTSELLCHYWLRQYAEGRAAYELAAISGAVNRDAMIAYGFLQPCESTKHAWLRATSCDESTTQDILLIIEANQYAKITESSQDTQRKFAPNLSVAALQTWLWSGYSTDASEALYKLIDDPSQSVNDRADAAYSMARWHATNANWDAASSVLRKLQKIDIQRYRKKRCKLLQIEVNIKLGKLENAESAIEHSLNRQVDGDYACAKSNLLFYKDGNQATAERVDTINSIYKNADLLPITFSHELGKLEFGKWSVSTPSSTVTYGPKVSILMPVYEAEQFIETSVRSMLAQTWQNIEIIAVDDQSPDRSYHLLQQLALEDDRLKVFRNKQNLGAYPTRNRALSLSTGEYITVHDSDDWSHPQMIETQMREMARNPSLKATFSFMARVHEDMRFMLRPQRANLEYVHRSYPSLLMRREDIDSLGEWDGVSANADDEFVQRLTLLWGKNSISEVMPGVPLSFFLVHDNSLTQQKGTSLNSLTFGIRREYSRQAEYWRKKKKEVGAQLAYTRTGPKDPFPIPAGLAPKNWQRDSYYDIVLISDLSLLGGTRRCNEGYIDAATELGLRIGLFHWPRFDLKPAEVAQEYLDLSYRSNVDILVPEDDVQTKAVLIHHPPILRYQLDAIPKISADQVAILVNQSPMQCWTQSPHYYDGQRTEVLCRELFDKDPIWLPISPRVRTILNRTGGFSKMADRSWYPPYQRALADTPPTPPQGLGSERRLILGRHARDHWTKWPATKTALQSAYCAEQQHIDVRLLGGAASAERTMNSRPSNWTVMEFDSCSVCKFLEDLDFFIHYVHGDYIEEFGRNVMEAMAAGRVAILPPEFHTIFEDAAVYATPDKVSETAWRIWMDPDSYHAAVSRGFEFVRRNCSPPITQDNLRTLVERKL